MAEQISKELFNQFRTSSWPAQFSDMAQIAAKNGVAVDQLHIFKSFEISLYLAPLEDKKMLKSMGIFENRVEFTGRDGSMREPYYPVPRFTDFGKEVMAACKDLYTPEDITTVDPAAAERYDEELAEMDAIIDSLPRDPELSKSLLGRIGSGVVGFFQKN